MPGLRYQPRRGRAAFFFVQQPVRRVPGMYRARLPIEIRPGTFYPEPAAFYPRGRDNSAGLEFRRERRERQLFDIFRARKSV